MPAGKTVLELNLPELRAGERLLAENIRLHVSGGEKVGILGPRDGRKIPCRLIQNQHVHPVQHHFGHQQLGLLPSGQLPNGRAGAGGQTAGRTFRRI